MTNLQRDELLISLSKSVNLINENLSDFKKEHKQDMCSIRAEIQRLDARIDNLDKKLDVTKDELNARIDNLDKKLETTKDELNAKIDKTKDELYNYIEKTKEELNNSIKSNIKGAVEIIHAAWRTHDNQNKKIQKHELEIQKLKARLA